MTTETFDEVNPKDLNPAQVQRAVGAMIGAAVGDALGAFFEFGPAGQFRLQFPSPKLVGHDEMIGGGAFDWKPGEFTDDTQMAVALAEAIVACGGSFDAAHTFDRFVAWSKDARDVGITTSGALRSGKPWHAAAEHAHNTIGRSAGNGSVMRIAPIGIAGVRWGAVECALVALQQSSLTHFDPGAGVGAAIVAEMVRQAILSGRLDSQPQIIPNVLAAIPGVIDEEVERYSRILHTSWSPDTDDGPSNGSVWTCVAQAVWAVRTTSSFADAVIAAIELGGDTDTVAAVTGAIAGAIYGLQGIPVRWVSALNGSVRRPDGSVAEYDAMRLHDLARELLGLNPATRTETEMPRGPQIVATAQSGMGVHAANLEGAALSPADMAVVSMCIVDDRFKDRINRREVYMRDNEGHRQNPMLGFAVREAVDAIDAFTAAGHDVVVHCHGGRSRTGLVLKAWYMRHFDVSHAEAHGWLHSCWPLYQTYNQTFWDFLDNEWTDEVHGKAAK